MTVADTAESLWVPVQEILTRSGRLNRAFKDINGNLIVSTI
jgi:hypothetical protein